ncbi:MAG: glutamate synthase [Planctomycetes bacterium SM23_32]|nr:MAG: glutamate synthase [Planctomycetes bacterium SM23_32]
MTLMRPNGSEALECRNRSRDVTPSSGVCSRCIDGCRGNCEIFQASMRGRELLYPGPFGEITAGAEKEYPLDYSHLNIQGYALGAEGLSSGLEANPDDCIFPNVSTEVEYGRSSKVKLTVPVFTGALGSTDIAAKNWESFATGAAIAGITLVCGENVCGVDPQLELDGDGKVAKSPEMDRRVSSWRRWHNGYGDLVVQLNVEDTRLGVAEYCVRELGVQTIELKWGQGAKCIGGEIKVDTIERARELQSRGYLVTPDPALLHVEKAYRDGEITSFERHSRLGFVDPEGFVAEVERLRDLGAQRVTLKTGAYGARELAMALRWSAEAGIDLLTIDGAPGGTGMSPWRMMNEWGIPTFYLEALTYQFCQKLAGRGLHVPDIAIAGGLSMEDHIFKAIAMGAPYVKAICMGRALMIPGFVGKNVGKWLEDGDLPKTVSVHGDTVQKIFYCYDELKDQYGEAVDQMPLGGIAVYTFIQKLRTGLQQIMAGSRNFSVSTISRDDLIALTREAAQVSGIPYVMEAGLDAAEVILDNVAITTGALTV